MNTLQKSFFAISTVTVMLTVASGPVAAQTMRTEGPPSFDPLMQWADQLMPRNEFVLNSDKDIELIRYKTPRDIEICIARGNPNSVSGTLKTVPVQVSWDNDTGVIWPGNCLSFDAKSVKVRAAAPLPNDAELVGSFKVIH